MKKRYAVLGLSVALALALTVPAFGGPMNPVASISASVKAIANKALKKAAAAQKTANSALSTAESASGEAKKAQSTANEAKTSATNAQNTANEAKTAATNAQSTANTAKAAAEAANSNANNRIKESVEVVGTANPSSGTNTTSPKSATAECPAGQIVLGGGYFVNGGSGTVAVSTSNPDVIYGNGWFAEGAAISGTPSWSIQTDVMCGVK